MAHGKSKRPRKGDVKAAAERAEMRSKGEKPVEAKIDIDPAIASAKEIKAKMGRPTAYKPEYAAQASKICRLGATDAQLADIFCVSIRTIENWKNKHEDFLHALKPGKDYADDLVERSLFQKAIGYEYDTVKIFNNNGAEMVVSYREKCVPDTTAAIFWLKNRRADKWRDVHKVEHGAAGAFDHLSDDDLAKFVRDEFRQVEDLRSNSALPATSKRH